MDKVIFGALAGLVVLTAIPYGTFDPWWKAAFVCAVFGICIVAIHSERFLIRSAINEPLC